MKLSLIIAFIVFAASLLTTVLFGLQMIWYDFRQQSAEHLFRLLSTSVLIMLAALFYIAVGDAMIRVLSTNGKPSSDDKR